MGANAPSVVGLRKRVNNPPSSESAGDRVNGGISNGITGAVGGDAGRGIVFAPGPDAENWRWIEQLGNH